MLEDTSVRVIERDHCKWPSERRLARDRAQRRLEIDHVVMSRDVLDALAKRGWRDRYPVATRIGYTVECE
jgi:hypothetical protein